MKMFRILLLSLCLFQFLIFVDLLGLEDDELDLKVLCHPWISTRSETKLNAYYRLKFDVSLPSINDYMEEAPYDREERRKFKNALKSLYNEKFMKNLNSEKIEEIRKKFHSYKGSLNGRWRPSECVNGKHKWCEDFGVKLFPKIKRLLDNLVKLSENNLVEDFVPEETLNEKLTILTNMNKDNKINSFFENELLDVFYENPLAFIKEFKLDHEDHRMFFDSRTKGVLTIFLYVPMNVGPLKAKSPNCTSCSNKQVPDFLRCAKIGNGFFHIQ